MLPAFCRSCCFVLLAGCVAGLSPCSADEIVSPRKPWTTNKVSGSPEPPPPLKTVVRFPNLKLDQPLLIESDPAGKRLWVASQNGSVHSFLDNRDVSEPDLFVDLQAVFDQLTPHPTAKRIGAAYGLVHHPEYPKVPVCWIAYTLVGAPEGPLDDGTRVSRFNVTFDADGIPRCDVASEKVVLTFREGGHNGACLKFGPDGCLYISTGDSEVPNPPDPLRTGQDVTNLLSAILRIDVNATGEEPLYWIPADNPFVVTEQNPGAEVSGTPTSTTATLTAAAPDPQSRRRRRRQLRRREEQSAKDTTDDAADSTTAEGEDSSEAKPTTTLSGLPISYERSLPDSLRHPQEASWAEFSRTVDTFPAEQFRPEIFAYGFRNPWKMNFGPDGQLWVGDVGWEMYEMVYNVKRGGNYGWSVMEGPQQVLPNQKRGPTPILPAAVAYSHADGASVTGGFVYRGKKFPELIGKYIFGDWETRRIWASDITPSDDGQADSLTNLVDLVDLRLRIVAFGEDADRELIISNFYEGVLYELERNDAAGRPTAFPKALSETGIFADTSAQNPAPGVLPFEPNAPMWNDRATAQRWVGVPGDGVIDVLKNPVQKEDSSLRERMRFPTDSVLARTVTLSDDTGREVNLETQMLHYDGLNWYGYSYVWNPEQTDATLAPASGTELNLADYGKFAERSSWSVHSRSECLRCHNLWIGGTLAFTLPQLTRVEG
ncbi:MAG: PQQ-dependent sugar dehydrogenase [Planctomycetaceae bacterium]